MVPGSPAGHLGGCAPHHRSNRLLGGGKAAEGLDPPLAEPLSHHSSPAHLQCFLPLPPRGLSVPVCKPTQVKGKERLTSYFNMTLAYHGWFTKYIKVYTTVCLFKFRSNVIWSVLFSYRRDVRLIRGTMVVGHEGMELQRIEFKAGVVDVLHILHGVFVHGEQGGGLGADNMFL